MEVYSRHQPRGLVILFLTEIWERYGFYTIQTLLLLYLVHELGFGDKAAYRLFSGFSALLYGTQVIGGYLADRVLGFQRAVIYGSFLHIVGFLLLATPGEVTMMIGLGTLSCGAGFFKPNVSSLLGTFYGREDHRRDSGFTIFYMGINIGIFMAVISAYIGHHYGFHAGFAAAALAMTMSLFTFVFGRRRFRGHGDQPLYQDHAHQQFSKKKQLLVYLLTPLAIPFFILLVKLPMVLAVVLTVFVIATLLFVFLQMLKFPLRVRKELLALLILTFFSMIFWTFYMQMFMTVTLFTDRNVHRYIGHWHVPTAAFPALVGLFNVLLGPIFAWLWYHYGRTKWVPSTAMKFALAQLLTAICFFLLHIGIITSSSVVAVSLVWIVLFYFLLSAAELMLSPIGLAAVTRLAPPAIAGLMMGVWFLALSAGLKLAGEMSAWHAFSDNILDRQLTLRLYDKVFIHCGAIALVCAVVMLAVAPWLKGIVDKYIDSPHCSGDE